MKLYFKKNKDSPDTFFGIYLEFRGKICFLILYLENGDSELRKRVSG